MKISPIQNYQRTSYNMVLNSATPIDKPNPTQIEGSPSFGSEASDMLQVLKKYWKSFAAFFIASNLWIYAPVHKLGDHASKWSIIRKIEAYLPTVKVKNPVKMANDIPYVNTPLDNKVVDHIGEYTDTLYLQPAYKRENIIFRTPDGKEYCAFRNSHKLVRNTEDKGTIEHQLAFIEYFKPENTTNPELINQSFIKNAKVINIPNVPKEGFYITKEGNRPELLNNEITMLNLSYNNKDYLKEFGLYNKSFEHFENEQTNNL